MLTIVDIDKRFGEGELVLDGINLNIDSGEIICLLGPSGCGKTTLLRILAGLETADRGQITYHDRDLDVIPVHRRNFGFMFQDFALFPHRSVGENIAFGLRMAKWPSDQIDERVDEMLALTDLPGEYAQRSIFELSGGEQQRVALARSLAPGPELLLLDEPLGNLDRALRESLMIDLRAILKRLTVTAIYVTHDQAEAYAVADRIVLMRHGRIAQVGEPQEIYLRPASPEIARFLGFENILSAVVVDQPSGQVQTPVGQFTVSQMPAVTKTGDAGWLLVHPQALSLVGEHEGAGQGDIHNAIIKRFSFRGDHYEITVALRVSGGEELFLQCEVATQALHRGGDRTAIAGLAEGDTVGVLFDEGMMTWLGDV